MIHTLDPVDQSTLKRRVIPCLDVTDGRVVKGVEFVNLRDAGDPVELAAYYNAESADELVFLDITASSDSRRTMIDVVERTADRVFIPLTVGGGVQLGRRHASTLFGRRRQGLDEHCRDCRTLAYFGRGRRVRPAVHRRCHRRTEKS